LPPPINAAGAAAAGAKHTRQARRMLQQMRNHPHQGRPHGISEVVVVVVVVAVVVAALVVATEAAAAARKAGLASLEVVSDDHPCAIAGGGVNRSNAAGTGPV